MNIKVAFIDTGIEKFNNIYNTISIRNFSIKDEKIEEKYLKPLSPHGSECLKEYLKVTPNNVEILDFNITNKKGNITVPNIILAIKKSIEERVDLINISLGIEEYHKDLFDVCKEAVKNNIIIISAASHQEKISYPADFKNVVCVKVDQSQKEIINLIDETTISIPMKDLIIKENGVEFDFSSTSLASARFAGIFCSKLNNNPLYDKLIILENEYGIKINSNNNFISDLKFHESTAKEIIKKNKIAVVLFPFESIKKIDKTLLHKNIVAYYDKKHNEFYRFDNNKLTTEFNTILIINSSSNEINIPEKISDKYKKYKIFYIGKFQENKNLKNIVYNHQDFLNKEISSLQNPIILIESLCSDLNKFDIQLSLFKSFTNDGLNMNSVCYNPLGFLYDFDVFNYPDKVAFPDTVCEINNYMFLTECNKDFDSWLINVAGGINHISNQNKYHFGKLNEAFFHASNVDVVIISVNISINIEKLKIYISNLYNYGVKKVFLVLSNNNIDMSTIDTLDGLQTYKIDYKIYFENLEYLKKHIQEELFSMQEVFEGKLYNKILEVLS